MHDIYNFVSGPLAWVAFIVFIAGSLYRLINMIRLVNKKEKFIYSYMSLNEFEIQLSVNPALDHPLWFRGLEAQSRAYHRHVYIPYLSDLCSHIPFIPHHPLG